MGGGWLLSSRCPAAVAQCPTGVGNGGAARRRCAGQGQKGVGRLFPTLPVESATARILSNPQLFRA